MKAVSTYSGECDGLGYSAEMVGIEVVAYCEADKTRRARLSARNLGKPIFTSDEELTADALRELGIYPDIIFGGPPCQPFSNAGVKRGIDDPRHRWPQMLRIIQECRPRWVVVENVGGFVRMALDLVLSQLEAEGYEAGAVVLPALAVGAPHRRDRCFVVAYRDGERESQQSREQSERWGRVIDRCKNMGNSKHNGQTTTEIARGVSSRNDRGETGEDCTGEFTGSSEQYVELGDTESRQQTRKRHTWKWRTGFTDTGQNVEHSSCTGCEKHDPTALADAEGYHSRGFATGWSQGAIESRLGRVLAWVSHRLDEQMPKWPAWRGQEQYPWEPPRTGLGIEDRPRRIESLGLSVCPWQALTIFALIKELDDMMQEEPPCKR